jgi:hypothetical protein
VTQSLDSLLEHYQYLRHIGEYLLIAGLVGDLLVILFLQSRKRAEKLVSIIATAIIIVGVGIETLAGGRADDIVREMRAPRLLGGTRQAEIAKKLRTFGAHETVLFEISDIDGEIAGITRDLSKALSSAGWKAGFDRWPPTPPESLRGPGQGILVLVSPAAPDQTVLPAAKVLVDALRNEGLQAELSQAFVGPEPPVDNRIRVVVYSK